MIDWRDPDGRLLTAIPPRVLVRWGAAAVLVVALHVAAVWLAMHWRSAAAASGEPPPAVMIDLSPMSVAPEAPSQDVAPGPQMTEAQPETTPEPPEPPKPEPDVTPAPEPPAPEPDVKVPDLPKANDAAAVLTPPPPEPPKLEPAKPPEHKPAKPPPKKRAEHKKPRERADHAAPRTSAPPTAQAQRAERAAAPAAGAASSAAAAASWRSELMAHLNRYKRFPSGAGGGGVATISFTINRSGQVTGSRLLRSSGDSVLDAEAVALPRRASPVPAPPSGTGGSSIGLAVPIRFSR
ncbi:MAG: energy transducer TonB [Rhizobiales bacterium]|nr:energy transducer TonB [Hyphomicrobiales bacterium]